MSDLVSSPFVSGDPTQPTPLTQSAGPGQPSPQDIARVQANVAKMRAQGAPESEVLQYLQHEDSLNAPAPRTQGGTMDPRLKTLLDRYAAAGASDDEIRHVAADWSARYRQSNAGRPQSDADMWEQLHAAGFPDNSATSLVRNRGSWENANPADAWEMLVNAGVPQQTATRYLSSRTAQNAPASNADSDPVLIDAARRLATVRAAARTAGQIISPEDQEAQMRAQTNGVYGLRDAARYLSTLDPSYSVRNATRSFAQGFLGNWLDEALGHLPTWLGGGVAAEADTRARQESFARYHPVANALTSISGALSSGLLVPAGEAATVGGAMARGAATGLAAGTISGAGAGETPADRATGAALGGAAGLVGGALIPGAVGAAKTFNNPTARALARVSAAIEQSGGKDAVSKAAQSATAAGRGSDIMLGDLSDYLRGAADFAVTNDGDGSVAVPLATKVKARQADASDRLLGDVRDAFGGDADANARRAQLEASRQSWAAGPNGYGGLRDQNATINPAPIARALKQPAVASALKQARLAGDLAANSPLDAAVSRVADGGGLLDGDARPLSFDDAHQLKRVLDDRASAAFQRGNGALGHSYGNVRDAVNGALEESVPGYSAVNTEYARRLGLERALSAGEDAWNANDSRGLAQQLSALSPDELSEFRTGMASKLIAQLRAAPTSRDEATRLLSSSAVMNDKLQTVFGSQPAFESFMKSVGAESDLAKIKAVLGGSQTVKRLQSAGFDPAEVGLSAATSGPAGAARAAVQSVLRNSAGRATRNTARAMGPLLMTQGSDNIQALLSQLVRGPLVAGPWTNAAPAVSGYAASLFGAP